MATKLKATLQSQRELRVRPTPFAVRKLADISDIDLTNAEDGSVLVLNLETEKWTATRLLDNQFIEGGQF
jgi:hypothetical protein